MTTLRTLWKTDPGLVVSGGAHAALLVFLLVNFVFPSRIEPPTEPIAVEMVSAEDLDQIMNGEKTAKPLPHPQRRVDRVAALEERKPSPPLAEAKKDTPPPPSPEKANDDPGHDDKPTQAAVAPPPPVPTPPVPTPPLRPAETPTPTPPERPVEKAEAPTPPARPEPDKPEPPDAEALAPKPPPRPKAEPKKEARKEIKKPVKREVKVAKVVPPPPPDRPDPPKVDPKPVPTPEPRHEALDMVAKLLDKLKPTKPPAKQRAGNETPDQPHSDFSVDRITSFLDHEAPQRKAATGHQLTALASLGATTGHAEKMTLSLKSDIDNWLIDHYLGCWTYFGYQKGYVPVVRVRLGPDGSIVGQPVLLNPPNDPNLMSLATSAVSAVKKCDPLPIPDRFKGHYEAWRDRNVRFDLAEKT